MDSTIKSFLVGLGFGVDDASLAKFNKAISNATVKVAALYGSIKVMSGAVAFGISKVSESFEQLGYEYRIISPMINKTLVLRRELLKAYSAAGINITKVVQASVKLNMSIAKTKFALEAIYKSVASKFFTLLTKQSDIFREKLYKNMPRILNALEKFVKFIFKAFEAVTTLGVRVWSIMTRIYDFFVKLDKATEGWSTIIMGVIAAWKLLNLSFLATPLGMLLVGFAALLALWDDFKTFQEGGESLIDWGSETTRILMGIATAVGLVGAAIAAVIVGMRAYAVAQAAVNAVMLLNPIGLMIAGVTALIGLLATLALGWDKVKAGFSSVFGSLGDKAMGFLGGTNVAQNIQNNPIGGTQAQVNPLGSNVANSLVNQNVKQQTNINIMGSADANQTGKMVASEQGKVNFDMVRNMKGAAR